MVTLFYQTAIDHVYFYEIEFAKLIIRYHTIIMITHDAHVGAQAEKELHIIDGKLYI